MTSTMIPRIKAALISTGMAAMSLFLKSSLPIAVDFSVWSSFLSWLKPPYPFVVINVIIITILATSRYYRSIGDKNYEGKEILHGGEYKNHDQNEPMVSQAPPRRLEVNDTDAAFLAIFYPAIIVAEVERSEVVYEVKAEEEEENSRLINGGDEFVALPPVMDEPEIDSPVNKHLVPASSGHRKLVKASVKGGNRKKALRVVRPKRHETTTMENTLKMIPEEGKSTVFEVDAGDVKPAMRNSEIFKDVTNNYYQSPPVKMKKEMSPEEMDRKFEAFIKKVKKERLESLRLDKDMV